MSQIDLFFFKKLLEVRLKCWMTFISDVKENRVIYYAVISTV